MTTSSPSQSAKQKFAVFDIDGTIFRSGLYREVIFELINRHQVPVGFYDSIKQLEVDWKQRTNVNAFNTFQETMAIAFTQILPQIRVSHFEQAASTVFATQSQNVYTYTRQLIQYLKQQSYFLIAISGSQEEIVKPFADLYKFDAWIGQHYQRHGDFFTGQIDMTHKQKDKLLKPLIQQHNLSLNNSLAIGDSVGDVDMLSMVKNPIAFNPEADLFAHAQANSWPIVIERKNMIYQLTSHGHTYSLTQAAPANAIQFNF